MLLYHSRDSSAGVLRSVEDEVIIGGWLLKGQKSNSEMFGFCWGLHNLSRRHSMCFIHLGESQPLCYLPVAAVIWQHRLSA